LEPHVGAIRQFAGINSQPIALRMLAYWRNAPGLHRIARRSRQWLASGYLSMNPRSLVRLMLTATLVGCSVCLGAANEPAAAPRFSFSASADQDQSDAAKQTVAIQHLVSIPCRRRLKNQRILLLIGEHTLDQWLTSQERYESLFHVIDSRLNALGLKTYTQQQIKADIAQAEVDAYFKNDPDAALAASKRLGANYVLRGSITSQTGVNAVVGLNEVTVNIDLTLSAVGGRILSDVNGHADSYSGRDTLRTALALIREQADPLVAQLYNDYCQKGIGR
jgi:hypothetical protein